MQYKLMICIAFIMAVLSAVMTSFGMVDLFSASGYFILCLFITIDLGRFLLFNFTVNEWHNLRIVKYFIAFILTLLFCYSAIGVYSKLDSLVTEETKQAMINSVIYNKANLNANIKQTRSEDLAKIAEEEYRNALDWNKNDLANCIARAKGNKNAENNCNNTKRSLDNKASLLLKEALNKADESLDIVEIKTKDNIENRNEIANVLMTICKFTQKSCDTYESLQNSLTIVILLVIVGTDYLQIGIILAVNTRKNKKIKKEDEFLDIEKEEKEEKEEIKEQLSENNINNDIEDIIEEQENQEEQIEQSPEEKLIEVLQEDPDFGKKELEDGIITPKEMNTLLKKVSKKKKIKHKQETKVFKIFGPKPR